MPVLEEVRIERVDGVEDPATKREFLILKSEESDELRRNAEQALNLVARALELLHKSAPELPEETAQALNEVAKVLGLGIEFACKKPPKGEEEYGYGYGYPKPPKPSKKSEDEEQTTPEPTTKQELTLEAVREAVAQIIDERLSQLTTSVQKSAPKSSQVADPIRGKKLGSGLFTNIVFGENRR